jgi:cytochrome c556
MLEKIRFVSSRLWFHRSVSCSRTLLAVVTLAAVVMTPRVALPELRPIILDMLENLGEIDDIGTAVSVDDYGRVADAARSLQSRASAMKVHGEAPPGFDNQQASAWDDFLTAQETTALAALTAANEEDADAIMRAVEAMFRDSCIACHAVFREPQQRLARSVLFMSSFVAVWRDINRGLSLRDFDLIGRRARELEAMAKTLAWDQVIQNAFAIESEVDLRAFRRFIHQVAVISSRIEAAAQSEDAGKVVEATRQLWTNGCIACHDRFRG